MNIKKFAIINRIKGLINKLADSIPDVLTGKREVMSQKYISLYGQYDGTGMVTEAKRRTGKLYLLLLTLLVLVISMFIASYIFSGDRSMDLSRAAYGGDSKVLPARVNARYGNESQSQNVDLTINPKGLSKNEKERRLELTKKNIVSLIIGNNSSLSKVNSKLNLLTVDPKTGVEIAWDSEEEELISNDGEVNLLVAKDNEEAVLNAQLRLEDITDKVAIQVSFGKVKSGDDLQESIGVSVENAVNNINESNKGSSLVLPEKTPEGVDLEWSKQDDMGILTQVVIIIFIGLMIYLNRFNRPNKVLQEVRESIVRDFPDFINKLVLLLNAGMVVTTAFSKISEDYRSRIDKNDNKYLYEQFCHMDDNIKSANSGFLTELNDIAQRSGVRDVMRFNTIIADNIDKGSTLVDKLQNESRMLWTGRIKMAEEKGRIAETKLTFPMVLQLLVLIIITIAPAAMEM
jgi:hypothetical protein